MGCFFLKCLLVFPYRIVVSVMELTLKMTCIVCMAACVNGMVVRLFHTLLKENTLFNIRLPSDSSIKSLLVYCQP